MTRYLVSWEIDVEDVEQGDVVEAARRALEAQRREGSIATVFKVVEYEYIEGRGAFISQHADEVDLDDLKCDHCQSRLYLDGEDDNGRPTLVDEGGDALCEDSRGSRHLHRAIRRSDDDEG